MSRWAWAFALVLTLIVGGLVVVLIVDPVLSWRSVVVLVLTWIILTITIRFSARYVPKMTFPGER